MYLPYYHFYFQELVSKGGSWDGLIALATFSAVIVALFGERFWEWWQRPIILINFDRKSERCYRSATIVTDQLQDQPEPFNMVLRWYFRLKVTNTGLSTVRNLRAKVELFDVEKNELADRFEPTLLNWIIGSAAIDLAPNEEDYLKFISQALIPHDIKYKLRIEISNHEPRGIAWDRYLRPYKLRVTFHADNLSKSVIKFFKFNPSSKEDEPGQLEETVHW